ncbi:MAG: DNA mismatch repair endonuclease MutL [Bacillota bacterium]|nr:DNA mismatch repair endonuclease MutL [Bacillota bacterium]
MSRIQKLDQLTASRIAAGEVVERPASVIRELCDNALDAGATVIRVALEQGGIRSIRVQDDGRGMDAADARLAFEPHATSKITQIEDLDSLATMGFRGEALPAIAAVARVTLQTREQGAAGGFELRLTGGEIVAERELGMPEGTTVLVEDLFHEMPARFKFLRSDRAESQRALDAVTRLALARPDVSFRFDADGKTQLHTPGDNRLESVAYAVYGDAVAKRLQYFRYDDPDGIVQIEGLLGEPGLTRRSRSWETFVINRRPVQVPALLRAVEDAWQGRLMRGEFPFALLHLTLPPELIDVNVHPQKLELRFWNDSQVYRTVRSAVGGALEAMTYAGLERAAAETDAAESDTTAAAGTPPLSGSPRMAAEHGTPAPPELPDLPGTRSMPAGVRSADSEHAPLPQPSYAPAPGRPVQLRLHDVVAADEGAPADSPATEPPTLQARDRLLPRLLEARFRGVLFDTYLILEEGDDFFLVDQHAAHEKILYEQLLAAAAEEAEEGRGGIWIRQPCLAPLPLSLTAARRAVLDARLDLFEALGYAFAFGPDNEVSLSAVPAAAVAEPVASLLELLDDLEEEQPAPDTGTRHEERLLNFATHACKAAIKAHDHLHEQEVAALLEQLVSLAEPFQCPHGRPILIRGSLAELERRFRRSV